ncbi:hypothetical protein POTOM_052305 [Populus tomentosa]|uniref:Enoyl reductase (ER) domain-containing protein n=1 Tax=Populus tomentosa TaxID=118781 RepID=A0A8X7Y3B5_POPTO|nr:hypothetical protein POTOM_052305 [Populus tomentosa]
MASDKSENCPAWAAKDESGVLSPYKFKRRNKFGKSLYPLVPGHEIVGTVQEVGTDVQRFKIGDHVGVGTFINSCRDCEYCNDGLEVHCADGVITTINSVDVDGTITKGGYSSFIVVHERYCHRIPGGYPLALAAPLLCAGITVYTPMIRHKMNHPGKSLGLVGLGGLGHMSVKFGKAFGMNVTVFSTSISKKEEALNLLGADNFVVSSDTEQMEALDKSLDFIIDTASGEHPFDPYITTLKTAGVLVLVGAPSEMKLTPVKLLRGKVIYTRKTMHGNASLSVRILISLIWICILPYCGRRSSSPPKWNAKSSILYRVVSFGNELRIR